MDEHEWIEEQAARLRETLATQQVRAEVLALLGMDDGRRRARRLEAARAELTGLQLRWTLREDEQA
jgi:hypothetical protein